MDKRTILKLVNYLAECFEEKGVSVSKIILFGSYAQGNATKDSDVDLAVISDNFRRKGISKRAEIIGPVHYKVVEKFLAPMDIVAMSPEDLESEKSLVAGFVRKGKVIYPAQHRNSHERKVAAR